MFPGIFSHQVPPTPANTAHAVTIRPPISVGFSERMAALARIMDAGWLQRTFAAHVCFVLFAAALQASAPPLVRTVATSIRAREGVPMRTLRFVAMERRKPQRIPPPFSRRIAEVVPLSAEKQMGRPHTTSYVARMEYRESGRDRADIQHIRNTMRRMVTRNPGCITHLQGAVAAAARCSGPAPALVVGADLDLRPEPFFKSVLYAGMGAAPLAIAGLLPSNPSPVGVLTERDGFQMGGIHTPPIPAEMVNDQAGGDRTNQRLVDDAMREQLESPSIDSSISVTIGIWPEPAFPVAPTNARQNRFEIHAVTSCKFGAL